MSGAYNCKTKPSKHSNLYIGPHYGMELLRPIVSPSLRPVRTRISTEWKVIEIWRK